MTEQHIPVTSLFRISHSAFLSRLLATNGFWYIFAFSLLCLLSLVFGIFIDIRIFMVAVMAVLIGVPFLIFMLYWSYGMTRVNSVNVLQHIIHFADSGLTVEILRYAPTEEPSEEDDGFLKNEKSAPVEDWIERVYSIESYPVQISGGFSVPVREVASGETGFLICPRSGFPEPVDYEAALALCIRAAEQTPD